MKNFNLEKEDWRLEIKFGREYVGRVGLGVGWFVLKIGWERLGYFFRGEDIFIL